ncbi:protein wntless isoform X1 [Ixodes scapularis]|uniref:protein wntless isoform X1 n=1 Tax=Ixodes scapularis TaxID=6945 RepID=UPI00116191CE|nr:protein wntless isoform X1 [Ixodes scapularis]
MAGSILENLSGRKLACIVSVVLVIQLVCFLIGGLIAPAPSNADQILGTVCLRHEPLPSGVFDDTWHIPRGVGGHPTNCNVLGDLAHVPQDNASVTANHIVFAFQAPGPRARQDLDYSRWMQNLIGILQLDIDDSSHMEPSPLLLLEVKLGYRNKHDPPDKWTLVAQSLEQRHLRCDVKTNSSDTQLQDTGGRVYNCDVLSLFELGSLHHDFYLLNLRLPIDGKSTANLGLGKVIDAWLVLIHQNGGFTKVWVSLKTFFFPLIVATLIWYWRRIRLLARPPHLLEGLLLSLGLAMTLLNIPLEFLTLWLNMPFMLLMSDIRQGIFYATLLSFWLIFCGEHLMEGRRDDIERNRLRSYWKHLSAVITGCVCLFIFDLCERGIQLRNPFYSIWASQVGSNLALAFIILAGLSAGLYFVFLSYMLYRVLRNISFKRNALPSMSQARRMYYEGIIYRFKFLLLATQICAALTVIAYIVGQVSEGRWKWDEDIQLEFTSAFFTGVYGMWNLYVFMLLVLYAPSHKFYPSPSDRTTSQEEIEFSRLTTTEPVATEPTESSSLTEFAKKAALD